MNHDNCKCVLPPAPRYFMPVEFAEDYDPYWHWYSVLTPMGKPGLCWLITVRTDGVPSSPFPWNYAGVENLLAAGRWYELKERPQ